jgi:ubiquinone/menaquinone biosynthesis C-methylase UbiE
MPTQDNVFLKEGDRWFKRNQGIEDQFVTKELIKYLSRGKIKPKNILDIGCSFGFTLGKIQEIFTKAKLNGLEPSKEAIAYGKKVNSSIKFNKGLAHDLSMYKDNEFDLVIVSFVFHWIDRSMLLKSVGEIDRILSDKGNLIIQDFDPDIVSKVKYHHLPKKNVFTFKQKYWDMFLESKIYNKIFSKELSFNNPNRSKGNNRYQLMVLEKDLEKNYKEVKL